MKVPFFSNTGDGTHCWQAALMMALAVLLPDRPFTYEELDRISAKQPGKWTWPTAAMLWMLEQGLTLTLVEEFDYHAFADRGGDYLIERFGEEVGRAQIAQSDIGRELAIARRFAAIAPLEVRVPTVDDIRHFLEDGAVVIVNLNAALLHGREGYSGHFVVVTAVGEEGVTLHDPGLPPSPDLHVSHDRFERAWAYPSPRDRNLLAIAAGGGETENP